MTYALSDVDYLWISAVALQVYCNLPVLSASEEGGKIHWEVNFYLVLSAPLLGTALVQAWFRQSCSLAVSLTSTTAASSVLSYIDHIAKLSHKEAIFHTSLQVRDLWKAPSVIHCPCCDFLHSFLDSLPVICLAERETDSLFFHSEHFPEYDDELKSLHSELNNKSFLPLKVESCGYW